MRRICWLFRPREGVLGRGNATPIYLLSIGFAMLAPSKNNLGFLSPETP
jgi:hypothetical protein